MHAGYNSASWLYQHTLKLALILTLLTRGFCNNDKILKFSILTRCSKSAKWWFSKFWHYDNLTRHSYWAKWQFFQILPFWWDILTWQNGKIPNLAILARCSKQFGKMTIFLIFATLMSYFTSAKWHFFNFVTLTRCLNSAKWQVLEFCHFVKMFEFCHLGKLFYLDKMTISWILMFWWIHRSH